MRLKEFIIKDDKIIGVRVEDNNTLYDALYSNLTDVSQLELMNLGLLRGISCKNTTLTLEELKSSNRIKELNCSITKCTFERPKTYVPITQDFKRSIEYSMYDWYYNYPDKVLYVEGARQTGKTYSIKKFINEVWGSSEAICLNLTTNEFKEKWNSYKDYIRSSEFISNSSSTLESFLRYSYKDFDMDSTKVVYIDEIQEESGIYNTIREFARECKCRLIVSGSYLNIVSEAMLGNNVFKPPAGGDYKITMRSLSFIEFLQANGIINSQVLFKYVSEYTDEDNILFDKVQKLYDAYLRIGGYPEVVKEYINTNSIESALDVLSDLMNVFFIESAPYLAKCNPMIEFEDAFKSLFGVVTNTDSRLKIKDIAIEIKKDLKRKGKSVSEADICSTLSWLKSGGFILPVTKYRSRDLMNYSTAQRYYFYDLGVVNYITSMIDIQESTLNGFLAENFAFLQVLDAYPKSNLALGYLDLKGDKVLGNLELDLVYKDKNKGGRIGVEVKYKNSSAKSLNKIKDLGIFKSTVKVVNAKTDIKSGTIPIFCLRFYCLLNSF